MGSAGFFGVNSLFKSVLAFEPFNPARGKYSPLFTCIEGMTLRTNFHLKLRFRRAGLESVAAGTGYGGGVILGMNSIFHVSFTSFQGVRRPTFQEIIISRENL